MTIAMMNLRDLVEKSLDADLLGEMVGFTAECLVPRTAVGKSSTVAAG